MSKLQRGGDTAALLTGLGLGITLAIEAITLNSEQLQSVNGVVTIISRICALVGTYLVLVGLLLVARIPFVERSVGHDRMVTWHRKLGPWSLYLILGHFVTGLLLLIFLTLKTGIIPLNLDGYISIFNDPALFQESY